MGEFVDAKVLAGIDSYFLVLFLVEICLKSFASNLMYLNDGFNLFDTVIVVVSLVYNVIGNPIMWMGALRLVRVVVIIIRKITGNTSKLRHQTKNINPVESVIKILIQIKDYPGIAESVAKEARWAIDLIESNKLYEMNFDISSEQKNMDMDAKAWLNMTTDVANDTTRWFERDLDDFLREIHRENEEVDPAKIDEDEEKLRQLLDCNQRTWNAVSKMMDDFDNSQQDSVLWNFDVFKYHEVLGSMSLNHFGIRLFMRYGFIEKFGISESNLKNLMNQIKAQCYSTTNYHNVLRIIEVTRNFHYFIKFGDLMVHLSDLHAMAGFLATMLHDVAHPGVNNNFLVGIKHQKALRYNDMSVLENHHCAIAFKILLDPKNDIFEMLSEAQYWNVRQIIIKMILSTDISNHFELLSKYSSINSKNLQLILL